MRYSHLVINFFQVPEHRSKNVGKWQQTQNTNPSKKKVLFCKIKLNFFLRSENIFVWMVQGGGFISRPVDTCWKRIEMNI